MRAYVIQSGSMEPSLKTGSAIFTFPKSSYVSGDIVTFRPDNSKTLVTHRIVSKQYPNGVFSEPVYLTSGDANEEFDNWELSNSQIVGKVIFSLPYLGYAVDFVKRPQGFILLIIVPVTIIIYEELKFLAVELKKYILRLNSKLKKNYINENKVKKPDFFKLPRKAIVIPTVGVLLITLAFTGSYFSDLEKSLNNIFQAASSFSAISANVYESDPFTCSAGALIQDTVYGNVIFDKNSNKIKLNLTLSNLIPDAVYDLWVNQYPNGCPLPSPTFPQQVISDSQGNFSGDFEVDPIDNAEKIWISVTGNNIVLRSIAVDIP